jgi:hypothetical protein
VVAAPDAEDDPPAGQDVGHRVIFGQPQRMPHRHDVETAADVELLGDAAQMHRHHQKVRDQFRPFGLEMMLGHPEGVVATHTRACARGKRDQVQPIEIPRFQVGKTGTSRKRQEDS